jgi:hypothetical protein
MPQNQPCPYRFSVEVTIPDELDEFLRAKLQAGAFENPAAVVTAALPAWRGRKFFTPWIAAKWSTCSLRRSTARAFRGTR